MLGWWSRNTSKDKRLSKKYVENKTDSAYAKDKRKRTKIKNIVLASKNKSWKKFGDKIERNRKENQKQFYTMLKTMRKGNLQKLGAIKTKEYRQQKMC